MKNLEVVYLISGSFEQFQPEQKNLRKKIEKLKQSNKLNTNIPIAKTLKLLILRQNVIPLNIPIKKINSKPIFVAKIGPVLYLQDLKKIIGS